MIKEITSAELYRLISDKTVTVIDVRESGEYHAARIEGAVLIPVGKLENYLNQNRMDKNATYIMVCKIGNRSRHAAEIIEKHGYIDIYNLEDGIIGWISHGYPVENDF